MDCKYCGIPMVIGEAIQPAVESDTMTIVPVRPIQFKDMKVILVYKCSHCGHSEYIK